MLGRVAEIVQASAVPESGLTFYMTGEQKSFEEKKLFFRQRGGQGAWQQPSPYPSSTPRVGAPSPLIILSPHEGFTWRYSL